MHHAALESSKTYNEHTTITQLWRTLQAERSDALTGSQPERERERGRRAGERNDGATRAVKQILHRRSYKLRYICLMRSTRGLRPSDFLLPFSHITYSPSAQLPADTPSNSETPFSSASRVPRVTLAYMFGVYRGLHKMGVTHYRPTDS